MNKKSLAIILPVYNEEEIIETVITDWVETLKQITPDFDIYAYNDGSKDNTLTSLRRVEMTDSRIHVIDKANSGHGPTILSGYTSYCHDYEWLFQVDSDNEMSPKYFNLLWSEREKYDFLIGLRSGRKSNLPRKLLSFFSRQTVYLFFGRKINDVNSPYRLMRTSFFTPYFLQMNPSTFAPNIIVSGVASSEGARIFSIDVPYTFRTTGKVSLKQIKLINIGFKCLFETLKFKLFTAKKANKALKAPG